jgi:putative hemolysin
MPIASQEGMKTTEQIREDLVNRLEIRAGDLCVRLARNQEDIWASQRLRYQVFYKEMSAKPTPEMMRLEREEDPVDQVCDHLLVIDESLGDGMDAVVGTYRLSTRAIAIRRGGFFTASEFDIGVLEAYNGEVLELGRSCVNAAYRNGTTMQLLWRGVAAYVFAHGIELMFGCASFGGIDPKKYSLPFSYLHHYHLADESMRPRALEHRYIDLNMIPKEDIDVKKALQELPPLLKGYLRVGGVIGDGAVIDHQFGTTDVCIMVKTDLVTDKYYKHYSRNSSMTDEQLA